MASLRQIKRRMRSIENINDITKAMEMISAFRFKKAEHRFMRTKAYFGELESLVANLSGAAAHVRDPLFEKRTVKRKTLVVMTGDKGLCGAYNANLVRAAQGWLKANAAFEPTLVPVAKVGYEHFRKRRAAMASSYPEKSMVDFALARRITEELKAMFLSRQTDSVELLYTGYRPGGTGRNAFVSFLGLSHLVESAGGQAAVEYLFEPDFETLFVSLLGRYLEGKLYLALLESLTSEYSARMVAMKQATENGEEVLHSLKLLRNKTRQATITRELSEIVSGASALA
jgi:F-type H+-transporting ATPase subunit gamma